MLTEYQHDIEHAIVSKTITAEEKPLALRIIGEHGIGVFRSFLDARERQKKKALAIYRQLGTSHEWVENRLQDKE
jgi:hypothetical protein